MLPPGIYLLESGIDDLASPITIDELLSAHPNYSANYVEELRAGSASEVADVGVFRKSTVETGAVVVAVGACSSTMEVARRLLDNGVLGSWGAVVATEQKTGRGQMRRHWVSPPGNLFLSVVMPPAPKDGSWMYAMTDLLPLVAGYVCSDVLGGLGGNVSIKWPNDLIQGERKVGGMLIEEREGVAILGVGLNFVESPPDSMMREDHSVSAGILETNGQVLSPLALGETLVSRGKSVYEGLLDEFSPSQFSTMIALRLAWLGRTVLVRESGTDSYPAVIVGVSQKGGLVVRRDGEEHTLFSGSIYPL